MGVCLRAGTITNFSQINLKPQLANYKQSGLAKLSKWDRTVRIRGAFFDMLGNVREWTADWNGFLSE